MSKEVSTLEYLSNLQPIDTSIANDIKYMSFVHDPFALEQMQKLIEMGRIQNIMTGIQAKEMKNASGHCAFAFKDDYPWGTVVIDGNKNVVCKCINQECSVFSQCRKGISSFSESELETDSIGVKPDKSREEKLLDQLEEGKHFKEKLTGKKYTDKVETHIILSKVNASEEEITILSEENVRDVKEDILQKINNQNQFLGKFIEWLKNCGYSENAIIVILGNIEEYNYFLKQDGKMSIYEDINSKRLDLIIDKFKIRLEGYKYNPKNKYHKKYELTGNWIHVSRVSIHKGMVLYREFICTIENTKEIIAQAAVDIESKLNSEEHDVTSEKTGLEILQIYHEWMILNGYKKAIADSYVSSVKSANSFARKKKIWSEDIWSFSEKSNRSESTSEKTDLLVKSAFFKSSLSQYIVALRLFAKSLIIEDHCEENDEKEKPNISVENPVVEGGLESKKNTKEAFEKFLEVDQDAVIFAEPSEKMIVNAGPGTGKTYALIEKLLYLVNEEKTNPEEILVLCFSRAAVEVIENRLQAEYENGKIGMNWHSIDIRTFDSFATHLLAYVAENEKELLYNGFVLDYLDYDGRIKAVTDVLKKSNLIEQCMHLVVDEVQDLVASRAQLVMQLINSLSDEAGYTLLGDACQSIYDYQIQQGEVDSVKFYSWLFKTQSQEKFYSFAVNHRQVSSLESLGNEYRNAILAGNDQARKNATNRIFGIVEELPDINLKNTDFDELSDVFGDKSVGILTRTNGQALKISTWFRNAGIPHRVQKRLTDNSLNMWIANIFRDYENDTIDQNTFNNLYETTGDASFDVNVIWSAIEKTQYEAKDRYYVKDILSGILNNSKSKEFYTSVGDDQIVISNIHRSKGREYDEVVVLDDTLYMDDQEKKDLMEHKVVYVAVTRAKEKIYRTSIGTQYIKTDKNGDRRSYVTGLGFRKKKPYLSHIEIGRNYDFEPTSFAENSEIQEKFDDPLLLIGERVKLIKNLDYLKEVDYISYDIVLEDEMFFGRIGRTSKKFYLDLKRILKEVNNLPPEKDVYPEIYPSRFSEIYIDDVISIIGGVNSKAVAGKKYGDIMVWKGISVVGFAQIEKDTY